jgi:hypothetical protein
MFLSVNIARELLSASGRVRRKGYCRTWGLERVQNWASTSDLRGSSDKTQVHPPASVAIDSWSSYQRSSAFSLSNTSTYLSVVHIILNFETLILFAPFFPIFCSSCGSELVVLFIVYCFETKGLYYTVAFSGGGQGSCQSQMVRIPFHIKLRLFMFLDFGHSSVLI